MKQNDFVFFMRSVICNFENNNNHGTAHIYKNSLNSFITFCHSSTIPFRKITPELLKGFEAYLRQKQRSWNTVSTYLRALRATYNRAVDKHLAPYIPRLSSRFIQEHGQTEKKHWISKICLGYFIVGYGWNTTQPFPYAWFIHSYVYVARFTLCRFGELTQKRLEWQYYHLPAAVRRVNN